MGEGPIFLGERVGARGGGTFVKPTKKYICSKTVKNCILTTFEAKGKQNSNIWTARRVPYVQA
jgi:hypothetical protein